MLDFIGGFILAVLFGSLSAGLFRLIGRLLKALFLFLLSPYLLLRGWLHVRPRSVGVWELHQQGKQAAAHDMQYILSVVVALPLGMLFILGLWQVVKALW